MAIIKVTKISAAKSQLIEAIRLFFDPVSIHTLVGSASEILHDHFDKGGVLNSKLILHYDSIYIKDEYRKLFINKVKEAKNFFKHAKEDLEKGITEIEFNTENNMYYIFEAVRCLKIIEGEKFILAPEFRMFWIWFSLKYPDSFKGKLVENPEVFDPNNLKFFSEICASLRDILKDFPQKYPNDCKNAFMCRDADHDHDITLAFLSNRLAKLFESCQILEDGAVMETKQRVAGTPNNIRIYIFQEQNHKLPHFHLKIGNEVEASYDIENCQKLAGYDLDSKREKILRYWHLQAKGELIKIWNALQND